METTLFLMHADSDDGESLDWFVEAHDAGEAVRIYKRYLIKKEWNLPKIDNIAILLVPGKNGKTSIKEWVHIDTSALNLSAIWNAA